MNTNMRDEDKSKAQLISELRELRQQLEALKASAWSDKVDSAHKCDELILTFRQLRKDLSGSREETVASQKTLTESREARGIREQNLLDTNEYFNILGDLVPFGVWTADAKGNITFLSNAFLEMIGISSKDIKRLKWVEQLVRPKVLKALSDWSSSPYESDIWENEFTITSKNDRQYNILIRGIPLLDKDGEVLSWLGINLDISRRKQIEQELIWAKKEAEKAKADAEQASRHKSEFLAKMSHEIRTPMNSILGMLRLVLSGGLPAKQMERIEVAKGSAESLLWLLNDLLDLSKIEAGQFSLHNKKFRLRHLLNNVCKEIEVFASEKGIKHYLSVGKNLPTVLHGDPFRLRRILNNLLFNAIKFTYQGWISLEVEQLDLVSSSKDEDFMTTTVLFKVKDTGRGIEPDYLQSIFDSYAQGGQDSLSSEQGTGLGLAICKKLSEQMGGNIWAKSQPGEGSTFYVQIPFKTDGQYIEEPESDSEAVTMSDIAPLDILLVEDQKMNQIFTVDLLSSYGHRVTIAENGQKALDKLTKSSFDLVLMDIRMPVMDGIEATMRIRTADPLDMNPDIPVIGLSAHVITEKEMQRYQHAGFNDYVVKPVSFEKLFTAIKQVLEKDQE